MSFRSARRYWGSLVALFLVLPQLALGADWTFSGGETWKRIPNRTPTPLVFNGTAVDARASYATLSAIGGIIFEATAKPQPGWSFKTASLRYDPKRPDGQRLILTFDQAETVANIYDWQLIPIARFADGSNVAVVSATGLAEGLEHQQFHPAFKDTLLGVRLLQADLIADNPAQYSELPKYGGKPLVGGGERRKWSPAKAVNEFTSKFTSQCAGIESWLLADDNSSPTFAVKNGVFKMGGLPRFYAWREGAEEESVVELEDCSKAVNAMLPSMASINPPVYQSMLNTMRFAALFRYMKRSSPSAWAGFMKSIATVKIRPIVQTPMVSSLIEDYARDHQLLLEPPGGTTANPPP